MINSLPTKPEKIVQLEWQQVEPFVEELKAREINASNITTWLKDWTLLVDTLWELYSRLHVATSINTADKDAEKRFLSFMDQIYPKAMAAEEYLKQKLLFSGIEPEGFEIPLRNYRAETDLFRAENLPLLAQEQKLANEYNKLIGAQTVNWNGSEVTVTQLKPVYQETDRSLREKAWHLVAERQLEDRQAINQLWQQFLSLRLKIAENAGRPDYRAYRWQQMLRFDYTPEDALRFAAAIEEVVVPVATRIYERRRQQLGLDTLRPWDLDVDTFARPPLRPFSDVDELITGSSNIFHLVHPQLGAHFDTMVMEGLLDLENRKNKAPGAYCTSFDTIRRPFIFSNSVGLHDDVQTLLHEAGHAFHVFESAHLPYAAQLNVPMEFAEVASMSMEYLGMPFLTKESGGFYDPKEAARAEIEHLEGSITFWPYMAVVDLFQHWVYTHPKEASDPAQCDEQWAQLWQRFMPGIDYSGLDEVMKTGWHRKLHIHQMPFYYIEYGLAQLGAVQVWANSLKNPIDAVQDYRFALSLGGTTTLPGLFQAAGARLSFDAGTLQAAINLMETTIESLSQAAVEQLRGIEE
jgi:oligoendopeptidase F